MDGSERHHESGDPRPPNRRAPAPCLPPLDLRGWLLGRHLGSENQSRAVSGDDAREQVAAKQPAGPVDAATRAPGSPQPDNRRGSPAATLVVSRHHDRATRPAAYLAKVQPAIAGQRGHDRTFHAACILVHGFDLTIDEARPLLHHWNLGCTPPWSSAELEHKLEDAQKAGDSRPRGYLWQHDSNAPGRTVRRDAPHVVDAHGSAPPPSHMGAFPASTPSLQSDQCPDGQEANPHRLAEQFLLSTFAFAGGIGLRYWRDEFHSWDGTAYHAVPGSEMRAQVTRWIAEEFERLYRVSLVEADLALPASASSIGCGGTGAVSRGQAAHHPTADSRHGASGE